MSINVTQKGMEELFPKYPKCFYVFVGEKQINNTKTFYDNVEVISMHFGRTTPTSIVVSGKLSTAAIEELSSFFRNTTMVNSTEKSRHNFLWTPCTIY